MKLGIVSRDHPRQRVNVSTNGQTLGVIELNEATGAGPVIISIPVLADAVSERDRLVLEFDRLVARSPSG